MKLVIEIPEWAEERNIYVLAGVEGLAEKRAGENYIRIKTKRCNWCGLCCKEPYLPSIFPRKEDGSGECRYLKKIGGDQWECSYQINRPRVCCVSDPILGGNKEREKFCSIRYKEIPIRK